MDNLIIGQQVSYLICPMIIDVLIGLCLVLAKLKVHSGIDSDIAHLLADRSIMTDMYLRARVQITHTAP